MSYNAIIRHDNDVYWHIRDEQDLTKFLGDSTVDTSSLQVQVVDVINTPINGNSSQWKLVEIQLMALNVNQSRQTYEVKLGNQIRQKINDCIANNESVLVVHMNATKGDITSPVDVMLLPIANSDIQGEKSDDVKVAFSILLNNHYQANLEQIKQTTQKVHNAQIETPTEKAKGTATVAILSILGLLFVAGFFVSNKEKQATQSQTVESQQTHQHANADEEVIDGGGIRNPLQVIEKATGQDLGGSRVKGLNEMNDDEVLSLTADIEKAVAERTKGMDFRSPEYSAIVRQEATNAYLRYTNIDFDKQSLNCMLQ